MCIDLGDIRVTAQVIDIRFYGLPKETTEDSQDALAGYSYFAKMFKEMKTQGKSPYDAYHIADNKSKEKAIWSRNECVDMFAETYCYDEMLKEEGREEAFELSAHICEGLRENVLIPEIAKKYGVKVEKIEKMKVAIFGK